MLRYIDTFTRYMWLWFIPFLLASGLAVGFLNTNRTYTASAALWVEAPLFNVTSSSEGNNWDSPAKQMADLLTELMHTRQFVTTVVENTSRKDILKDEEKGLETLNLVQNKTLIQGDKFRLINLTYTDKSEKMSLETLDAVIKQFQSYYTDQINRQGESALVYYQKLVNDTSKELDDTNAEAKKFIDEHPNQIGLDRSSRGVSKEDLDYNALLQKQSAAQRRFDDASKNLERVLTTFNAYQQGQTTTLRVQDAPAIPGAKASLVRNIGLGVGAGLGVSLIIAVIGTFLLTAGDVSLRYQFQARQVLHKVSVVEIPNFRPIKSKKKQRKQLDLGYSGFEEGKKSRKWWQLFGKARTKDEAGFRRGVIAQVVNQFDTK